MKKFLQRVVLVAVAMATAQVAVAESWRINNDTSKGAHFVDINAAMASEDVKDGDVLYLDPGCVMTTIQTITKAVTIIGTGWDFSNRPYVYAQISNTVSIQAAAKIIGAYITGGVEVWVGNIIIERCRIDGSINGSSGTPENFQLLSSFVGGYVYGSKMKYATISNNYIGHSHNYYSLQSLSNATVTNNFLITKGRNSGNSSSGYVLVGVKNSSFKNNIMIGNTTNRIETGCSGNSLTNNCMSADSTTIYASSNVCMNTTDLSILFVNNGAAGGAWMQLCEGSPAIGAGEGGIDCGPYAKGSLYPFVTYGMPKHIPYFTEAVVPAQPTDGKVKVSLKIVNQND